MFSRMPLTTVAYAAVALSLFVLAALAPFISPYGETEIASTEVWAGFSSAHWLGTDNLGRDMFARILFGLRYSIGIAFAATVLSGLIGVTFALVCAVFGGKVDKLISRSYDVLLSIPGLILALLVITMLGSSMSVMIGVLAVLESAIFFRVCRPPAVDVMAMDYVESAVLRGERLPWFIGRELLPNIAPTVIAETGLRFSFTILVVTALSFLGLGIQPPYADLGALVRENVQAISFGLWAPIIPAVVMAILCVSVNGVVDHYVGVYSIRAEIR